MRSYSNCERLDRPSAARQVAKAAAKRGADLVWFQSATIREELREGLDDLQMRDSFRVLEGVIARCRQ